MHLLVDSIWKDSISKMQNLRLNKRKNPNSSILQSMNSQKFERNWNL